MAFHRRLGAIILSAVVLIVGIIHLGVGIGIVARYNKFHDVFQQQIGLSGFNIFIGLCTIIIGIIGLVSVLKEYRFLSKVTAYGSFVLGIIAFVSLITALALSGQAATYLHDTITDDMNNYGSDQDAIDTIDILQTTYQCCGVNLWLDWGRVSLGVSNGITVGRRRRRQYSSPPVSSLTRALRQKRQSTIYNLPSSYTINLPLSCCKSGGTTVGNSLGGYCVFSANNNTSSFYVNGCLEHVSNIGFSQITGITFINTCLTILAFVYGAVLLSLSPKNADPNNSNNKQSNQNEIYQGGQQQQQQPPQYPYGQYYMNNNYPYPNQNPNLIPYHIYNSSTYKTYL